MDPRLAAALAADPRLQATLGGLGAQSMLAQAAPQMSDVDLLLQRLAAGQAAPQPGVRADPMSAAMGMKTSPAPALSPAPAPATAPAPVPRTKEQQDRDAAAWAQMWGGLPGVGAAIGRYADTVSDRRQKRAVERADDDVEHLLDALSGHHG